MTSFGLQQTRKITQHRVYSQVKPSACLHYQFHPIGLQAQKKVDGLPKLAI